MAIPRRKNAPGPIKVRVFLAPLGSEWVLYDWVMRLCVDANGDLYLWDTVNPFRGSRAVHRAADWTSIERKV